jgi:hypothetical protein
MYQKGMAGRGLRNTVTVCARSLPWFERARAPGGSRDPWMGRHLVLASHLHLAPGEPPHLIILRTHLQCSVTGYEHRRPCLSRSAMWPQQHMPVCLCYVPPR